MLKKEKNKSRLRLGMSLSSMIASCEKAITAASLGNAMEWFDFGVYGFVAYALGKVFFPDADPSVQMIAALGTFSVPFLIRPLGGLFFGMLGDKYGRQKNLSDHHRYHVDKYILYRSYSVVCHHWYLGADSAAAV